MPLPRTRYLIELAGDDTVHEVLVLPVDQILIEQAGPRLGVPSMKAAPMTTTMMWMWAAARRSGLFDGEWPDFKVALVAYDDPDRPDADDPDDDRDRESLDPTQPAGSTSLP